MWAIHLVIILEECLESDTRLTEYPRKGNLYNVIRREYVKIDDQTFYKYCY